jgi:UrcA family protein
MERIMSNIKRKNLNISLVLAFAGLFVAADLAVAQQVTEEIVVRSPIERTQARIPIGSSVNTQTVELNQYVSFDDLDLTKNEDIEKLDTRISEIAKESCEKLSEMFPLDRSDLTAVNRCMKKAISYANEQKEKFIATGP